jgi:predicted ATPase
MVLARMVAAEPENWLSLRNALSKFGKACGLFDTVTVRRPLGKKESDPFQIQIRVSGPAFNLVDVGYGVSQVLPILVDSLMGKAKQMFLMQQPEVHLHPKAQAELASFLAHLVKEERKSFVIETHSDYLIDRIRLDIRDGVSLKPEDVVILYFQRGAKGVRIHPIRIDQEGNIVGAPRGYRQFFLDEERRFLVGRNHVCHH